MMEKTFSLMGKTAEGRPLIHLVEPGSRHGLDESAGLDKTASGEHLPEVIELIESIRPQTDRLYVVNSALGAGEYVGFNLRGDWFTERGLVHTPRGWDKIPVWDIDRRRQAAAQVEPAKNWGSLAWGYPTFYNAHRFRHHVNKDPNRAYGYILGAFWDPRMHRVILVSELIRSECARLGALDLYERIARGEFPDTSMGAKVPYDRCAICNHYARTPRDYCEHVRRGAMPPYGMRSILPDGRMCGVYNDYPRFFDDSFVFIGAERSAKIMANVTSMVKGAHPYTSRLYALGSSIDKAASAPDGGGSASRDREAEEADLGKALATAASPVAGPESRRIGDRLERVMSMVPILSDPEKKALDYVAREVRQSARKKDGGTTEAELELWRNRELQKLQGEGVGREVVDRARALLHFQMERAFGEKLGDAAKWAAHLKRIPAPSEHQKALIRDHEGRLSEVLPRPVLDHVAEDMPRGLSVLAHLGVVLRHEEYQFCVLKRMGMGERAEVLLTKRVRFRAVPVCAANEPVWRPRSVPESVVDRMRSALGGDLVKRSFAPAAVHERLLRPPPLAKIGSFESEDDPILNKIAQLYSDYRTGLVAHSPLQGYADPVPGPAKLAETSGLLSNYLLHLAYWPQSFVG
jgi:hypothetical protein